MNSFNSLKVPSPTWGSYIFASIVGAFASALPNPFDFFPIFWILLFMAVASKTKGARIGGGLAYSFIAMLAGVTGIWGFNTWGWTFVAGAAVVLLSVCVFEALVKMYGADSDEN